eukprot:359517-Chlamydomonas_euryale.AAC.23
MHARAGVHAHPVSHQSTHLCSSHVGNALSPILLWSRAFPLSGISNASTFLASNPATMGAPTGEHSNR